MKTSTKRAFARPIVAALLASAALPGYAIAQDDQSSDTVVLEEIFVTAERRDQNLQDIPISATVLSADTIARRGVKDVSDLQNIAPSVAINTYNRSTFINIRGVGIAQSAPTSNPGVAYYIDGQLIPHEQFIGQSFFDIGSIEVLRGPQGTLTGQNSTGGAIYVRTPEPEYDNTSGYGDLTVGDYGKVRMVGALNHGLSENAAFRIAYVHDERNSYWDNIGTSDSTPGNMNLDAVRMNMAFRSSDDKLRANIRGEYFNYDTDYVAYKNRNDAVSDDPFVIEEDAESFLVQKGYRISGEARYALTDGIDARALVSWQDGYTFDQVDGDRTSTALPVPADLPTSGGNRAIYPGRVSTSRTDFETFIAEANLLSTGDGPVQWVVGAFLMDESVPVSLLRDNRNTEDYVEASSTIITEANNKSKSLFGQVNWFATDVVEVFAGARYSWDEQAYTRIVLPGPPADPFTTTLKTSELTGKIGVNFHIDDDTMVYLIASKGYKAGGVNLTADQGNFQPEKNFVYEAGFKAELADRHVRVNGDVYYSDYQDIQLSSLSGGLPVTQNAASGKAWGAELEVLAQFGGFGASFGAGYLNAEFDGDVCLNNTNSSEADANCPTGNQLVPDGRVLPFSPEWTINAGVEYDFQVGDMVLTPRLQWAHLDGQYATPFPSDITFVPSRDIFDVRLTLDVNESWLVEGFVSNVTDKTYIASQVQNSSSADGGIIYGAPRTFGIRAMYKFGN